MFLNAQLDTFLTDQSANYQSKPAHQDNFTTLKLELVLPVHSHALNASSPTLTVLPVHLDSHFQTTNVPNQTAVDQEDSELPQDHAQLAQPSALTVSAPLNVPLALQVMFLTEQTVF